MYKRQQEWEGILKQEKLPSGILQDRDYPGIFHEDKTIVTYPNALSFLQHLKRIGAYTPREHYKPMKAQTYSAPANILI